MSVAEIRMLRWISGNTQKDRIQNEEIRLKIAVVPIDEKMGESLEMVWSCLEESDE